MLLFYVGNTEATFSAPGCSRTGVCLPGFKSEVWGSPIQSTHFTVCLEKALSEEWREACDSQSWRIT